jgi:death on curing protein
VTEYVSTGDALFFHKQLIERYGGASGVRDLGALESALHRPQTGYYDTFIEQAAALFESLLQNHPLVDGNKRVAFAVVDVFVRINGYRLASSSESIYEDLITFFANQTVDMEHWVPWLKGLIKPNGGHKQSC